MALHLHLCDRNTPLCDAWQRAFADQALVTVHLDDFFAVEADIMVSGGNSLGFMDVGLELAISLKLGRHLQERLQGLLRTEHDGVLPIGQAVMLPTDDRRWPRLLVAPTMWLPMDVDDTINPYLATRAALRLCRRLEPEGGKLWHVLMPGLGTGLGRVRAQACAVQMRRAYDEIVLGRHPQHPSVERAHEDYRYLLSGGETEEPAEER